MGSALPELGVPSRPDMYDAVLEGFTRANEIILQERPELMPLYGKGVHYELRKSKKFRHADDVVGSGWGDCEALSTFRAAELRTTGEDMDARARTYRSGPLRYHAVVERGNGLIEDPSAALGMRIKDPKKYKEHLVNNFGNAAVVGVIDDPKRACMVVGEDPTPGYRTISFDLYKVGNAWSGVIRIPFESGNALFMKTSAAPSPAAADAKLANLAKLAASTPGLADLIPPEAAASLENIKQAPKALLAKGVKAFQAAQDQAIKAGLQKYGVPPEAAEQAAKAFQYINPAGLGAKVASKIPGLKKLF